MNSADKQRYIEICDRLIEEAGTVIGTQFKTGALGAPTYVDVQVLHAWWAKVKSLQYQLGTAARPWRESLTEDPQKNTLAFAKRILGVLEAVRYEIEHDHLRSFSQIVHAETLVDLLDQAEALVEAGYFLAGGVICRAVLEEHLKTLCSELAIRPDKAKPTINDYNQALYKNEHYSKTRMKHIDMLASIGNDAAHNSPSLDETSVRKFIGELPELIEATGV